MRGTASVSMAQWDAINEQIRECNETTTAHFVLTVDIHFSFLNPGSVRVGLHRAHAHTFWFGVERDGKVIPSHRAA